MSLSKRTKDIMVVALADKKAGQELAEAVDSGSNEQAANVAELGATADLSAVAGTYAIPAEPTGAEVDATLQASVDEIEARLDAIEAKIDELLAAMVAANQMEAP